MRFSKLILKGSETIGNIRYPVGEGAPYTLLPLCFLAPIHSTHHTTTVLYVIPSPHTCISTLLLWQFCTAFTYGISSCQSDKQSIDFSMTSLLPHTVAQPTKWRFLPKNLNQLVIFVIGLAFT